MFYKLKYLYIQITVLTYVVTSVVDRFRIGRHFNNLQYDMEPFQIEISV